MKEVTPAVSSCSGKKTTTTNTGPGISVIKNRAANTNVGRITAIELLITVDRFLFAQGFGGFTLVIGFSSVTVIQVFLSDFF
jgi:hypothetical protein